MKNKIIGFIFGVLLTGGLVYAAYAYQASEIGFSSEKSDATNVQEAIDELYDKVMEVKSTLITNFKLKAGTVNSNDISLVADGEITTSDNSSVHAYILFINGTFYDSYGSLPIKVEKLNSEKDYTFEVIAVDREGGFAKSGAINVKTAQMEPTNLNIINRKSFSANGYSEANVPKNAIDDSMKNGNGYNWYGGSKLLIEYNYLSTIYSMEIYTTDNWGVSFKSTKVYYSEDDSLTLTSDLSQFPYFTVTTEQNFALPSSIKAKRVLLTKNTNGAVYEFKCIGTY